MPTIDLGKVVGDSETAQNAEKLGGKVPEYYLSPRNLLDNSDFTNPVNQRGVTSTTITGTYIIDRWQADIASNAATVNVVSGGIQCVSSDSNYAGIVQNFENYADMAGKTYTIAVRVAGVWEAVSFVMGECSNGLLMTNGVSFYSVGYDNIILRATSGQTITLEQVALYEGTYTADNLPPYVPKGYAAELVACNVADTGNVTGMTLLWENASPTSEFAAQMINFDAGGYSKFEIEFGHYLNETSMSVRCVIGHDTKLLAMDVTSDNFRLFHRELATATTGVYFRDAFAYAYGDNAFAYQNGRCVPHRIYGIR